MDRSWAAFWWDLDDAFHRGELIAERWIVEFACDAFEYCYGQVDDAATDRLMAKIMGER